MTENNTTLSNRFRKTTEELLKLIERFDRQSFNRKPSEEKWSAAEVAEHLLLFDLRLNDILKTATQPTDRDIVEKVTAINARVSDRKNKIEAPPFLIPSNKVQSPEVLSEKIRAERIKICSVIEETDLSLHSKEFPHRLFGELTVHEWVNLVDQHTHRHIAQLEELLSLYR